MYEMSDCFTFLARVQSVQWTVSEDTDFWAACVHLQRVPPQTLMDWGGDDIHIMDTGMWTQKV